MSELTLIQRLRICYPGGHWSAEQVVDLCQEAADEIEQSRSLLTRVMDYRRGNGKYNFSNLRDQDRDIAVMEAWEEIEDAIEAFLTTKDRDDLPTICCGQALSGGRCNQCGEVYAYPPVPEKDSD